MRVAVDRPIVGRGNYTATREKTSVYLLCTAVLGWTTAFLFALLLLRLMSLGTATAHAVVNEPGESPALTPLDVIARLQQILGRAREDLGDHSASVAGAGQELRGMTPGEFLAEPDRVLGILEAVVQKNSQLQGRLAEADSALAEQGRALQAQELAAMTDPLTGLPNRRAFDEQSTACCRGTEAALLILDLDHFKRVNDTWGHPAGDAVLVSIAETLRSSIREQAFLARLGGEEFAVLLVADAAEVATIAERLRAAVEATVTTHGAERIQITVSVGGAARRDHEEFSSLYRRADEAAYAAKAAGRNCFRFHDGSRVIADSPQSAPSRQAPAETCRPAIASRTELLLAVRRLLASHHSGQPPSAVVLLEVDCTNDFRQIALTADDPTFLEVVAVMQQGLRQQDLVADYDTHRVAILLPSVGNDSVDVPLTRVARLVEDWAESTPTLSVRLHFGVAVTREADDSISLFQRAEQRQAVGRRTRPRLTPREMLLVECGS